MKNVVVVGSQWGDEGKGKIVDWLSSEADVVVRFQGGHNAGHTLVIDKKVFKLRLLPSGIVRKGKISILGNGVVIDPWALLDEIEGIKKQGIDAIDAQIDHIDGLIESGSEDGLGGCTTALDLANDLKLLDSVNGDQRGEIDTAITRAQTCIEIRERPLREEKERINKVHTNLEKYKKWYSILLDDYGVALSGFNLAISPNDFNFDIAYDPGALKLNILFGFSPS